MAAPQVHDKSGTTCYKCGKLFDKRNMTIPITRREGAFWVRYMVCIDCKLEEIHGHNALR